MTRFPGALGLSGERTRQVLVTAGRAPSVHNTQPWRFRPSAESIELHADPARHLGVSDPDRRELRISCGAALFTLRIALCGLGLRPVVALLPDPGRPDLLAVLRDGGRTPPHPDVRELLAAVPRRHTNRRPFSATAVAAPEQHALRRAALREGASLHVVADREDRAELGRLAADAHRRQMADADFRAELARWTGTDEERRDGVPVSAGGPLPEPQDTWVHRDYTAGRGRSRAPGADYEDEPLIAVLTSHTSGPAADLRAGEALQRILLTATASGLAVSFLSQLVEVAPVRERVRELIGSTRTPLAVLRIGHGWPVAATPRLAVEDLLLTGPAQPAETSRT
jgi:nitroreductase